jgi:hypothetical protein
VHIQAELLAPGQATHSAVVTDGSQLHLTLTDKQAGATVRGHGSILDADGLTGASPNAARIDYDVDRGTVKTQSPSTGTLAVTRGKLHVSSVGASALTMSRSGTATAKAAGGRVSLVLSSAAGGPLASAMLTLRLPKNALVLVAGSRAKRAIRHGGEIAVSVRRGRSRRTVRVSTHSVAGSYRLRAQLRVKARTAKVRLFALRHLPRGAEGWVDWRVRRGKKTLLRRRVRVEHPRTHDALAPVRLPKHLSGVTVKAIVHVIVTKPGPAELVAVGSHRIRGQKRRHRHLLPLGH